MKTSDDRELVEAASTLVRRCWALLEEGDPRPPLRSDQLSALLVRTRTRVCEYPFRSGTVGMAIPWGSEEHAVLIDSTASRADYEFTLRHEIAHILAGEVSEALFLTEADAMSFSERRADLFAVVDLVPGWLVGQLRGRRRSWTRVRLEVQHAFRGLTVGWSEARLIDRARLRVEMYREAGI